MTSSSQEFLTHRKFIYGLRVHLQRTRVTFVCEGHPVKVKVTGATNAKFLIPCFLP